MSRIHEALKKAEQERAAGQPTTPPTVAAEPDVVPLPELARPRASDASLMSSLMPNFAGSFSVDTLLARCPQMEWKPDFGTMLFMNGDDSKRGT